MKTEEFESLQLKVGQRVKMQTPSFAVEGHIWHIAKGAVTVLLGEDKIWIKVGQVQSVVVFGGEA